MSQEIFTRFKRGLLRATESGVVCEIVTPCMQGEPGYEVLLKDGSENGFLPERFAAPVLALVNMPRCNCGQRPTRREHLAWCDTWGADKQDPKRVEQRY